MPNTDLHALIDLLVTANSIIWKYLASKSMCSILQQILYIYYSTAGAV